MIEKMPDWRDQILIEEGDNFVYEVESGSLSNSNLFLLKKDGTKTQIPYLITFSMEMQERANVDKAELADYKRRNRPFYKKVWDWING